MAAKGDLGPPPSVGGFRKVFLPGETPWAECVVVHSPDEWTGRIANTLVSEMSVDQRTKMAEGIGFVGAGPLPSLHDYRHGMTVRFKRSVIDDEIEIWEPCEPASGSA